MDTILNRSSLRQSMGSRLSRKRGRALDASVLSLRTIHVNQESLASLVKQRLGTTPCLGEAHPLQ